MTIFQKKISGLVVLLMLASQLLLAQHYTVHFNEDGVVAAQQSGHDAPTGQKKDTDGHDKVCQICIFSKSLSHLVLFALAAFLVFPHVAGGAVASLRHFTLRNATVVYSARGPPAFLS